jgi:hypothetical protein
VVQHVAFNIYTECMNQDTKVWEEGFVLNLSYRKPGGEMVVDPQTGETAWLESDCLRDEALSYQGPRMVAHSEKCTLW